MLAGTKFTNAFKALQSFNSVTARSLTATAARSYNVTSTNEQTFMASDITIHKPKELRPKPGPDHQYTFGGITTDYMLEIDYDYDNGGW